MSKTVELQISKAAGLVEGLRRHVREMGERGVTNATIDNLERAVKALEESNKEVDALRAELQPKVKVMNELLAAVKEQYAESKKTLKGYYPQERWADYGVPDKR